MSDLIHEESRRRYLQRCREFLEKATDRDLEAIGLAIRYAYESVLEEFVAPTCPQQVGAEIHELELGIQRAYNFLFEVPEDDHLAP